MRRIIREIMPNGMPFMVQAEIKQGVISLGDVKVYPILEKNTQKGLGGAVILESIPFDIKQQEKLAQRFCDYLNK